MKYWVYINGEVPGCFTRAELVKLPEFGTNHPGLPGRGGDPREELAPCRRVLGPHAVPARTAPEGAARTAAGPPRPADVDALIDTASNRLFSHVADLMKELETRRRRTGADHLAAAPDPRRSRTSSRKPERPAPSSRTGSPASPSSRKRSAKDDERIQSLESAIKAATTRWRSCACSSR